MEEGGEQQGSLTPPEARGGGGEGGSRGRRGGRVLCTIGSWSLPHSTCFIVITAVLIHVCVFHCKVQWTFSKQLWTDYSSYRLLSSYKSTISNRDAKIEELLGV